MKDEDYWLEKLNDYIWSVELWEAIEISDIKREQVVKELINDEELWEFIEKKMDYYIALPPIIKK